MAAIVAMVQKHGGEVHILTQRDRKVQRSVDPGLYQQRNLIERLFCKLKHFTRITMRFDNSPETPWPPCSSHHRDYRSELVSPRPSAEWRARSRSRF
ncbi:hypothetical protein [Pararhizobium sp. BT-229]|uniref:hypothetical protein n=1 Tax=Pararhizobium sp. BT-229 TaxID=2986923 RepID=UPI003555E411